MQIYLFLMLINFIQSSKIAIIGTGISGTSMLTNLRDNYEKLEITIFERNEFVGGRTTSKEVAGHIVEQGAHFIIDKNKNMLELVKRANLTLKDSQDDGIMGIYKDKQFKLITSKNKFVTLGSFLYNYGFTFIKFLYYSNENLQKFMKAYEYLDQGNSFNSYENFLEKMEFRHVFNQTTYNYMVNEMGYSKEFVTEILDGVISNFYNQNVDSNGFVGLLASWGFLGEAYKVKEGLNEISKRLLQNQNILLNSEVQRIVKNQTGYTVHYIDRKSKQKYSKQFDLVIIATTLEQTNIQFENIHLSSSTTIKRKSLSIHKYIIGSKKFNVEKISNSNIIPNSIISPDRIFSKISVFVNLCNDCHNNMNLYVMSCNNSLTKQEITTLYSNEYEIVNYYGNLVFIYFQEIKWAYPDFRDTINKQLPQIKLDEGLYYLNGMEFLASCMEMQTISARNVLNMIKQSEGKDWKLKSKNEIKSDL